MFAIVTAADGTGTTSAGSCYNMTTHAVSCNMSEVDCSSPHMWYGPGYVSPRSGCCHCEASCANTSGHCTYYDAVEDPQENWGCYEQAAHQCDCLVSEAGCTAKGTGHTWTSGCTSCASQGSCYDMTSHEISCDVPETSCSSPNMWYAPGYVSPRSGCCHCRASCKEPADNCTYYDAVEDPQENWGCYEHAAHQCDCLVSEAGCTAKGAGHTWTSGCTSCASQGSCYDMTSHEISCDVPETSCSSPNMWYAPGYVSPRSGCCHCRASCKEPADNCTYYDAVEDPQENWGCYEHAAHQCDCLVSEAGCTAKGAGHTWTSGCTSCASQGSCYDMTSHEISCDVPQTSCSSPNMWYAPGYVSPRSGCCHCRASCKEPADNCSYSDAEAQTQRNWGCYDSSTNACDCDTTEAECSGSWTQSCRSCNGEVSTSSAGRPRGFVVALLVLLYSFFAAEANTGTGCYDIETHRCDCTVTETECLAQQGHWTDTCRSCDSTTNEQHPDCQRQYSWGCFDEASHACQCTVSERACDTAAGKFWTHECWSCCHGSAWGCFVPGNGPESGCHCNLYEGACALDFPDATWSHQCFECEEDSVQKDAEAAMDDGGVGVAVAVSVSVTVVVIAACIGIYCLWAKMRKPKPVNEPYNSPQFNQSDVVVGLAVSGSAPSPAPAATPKEVA